MPAFSIFALGTLESAEKERSIITQFYHACTGPKLILDGLNKIWNPSRVEYNVTLAVHDVILWLNSEAELEKTSDSSPAKYRINLTGYSRGGVTCTMIANRLQAYLEKNKLKNKYGKTISINDVELNIFALDPVAGLFEKRYHESKNIPSIVKNYIATLQMHDYRKDFVPQDLSRVRVEDTRKSNVVFLPMYGYHSASTKIMDEKLSHTVEISWQLLSRFFKKNGTPIDGIPAIPNKAGKFTSTREMSNQELLNLFALAKENRAIYEAKSEKGFSLSGIGGRSFVKRLDDYVEEPEFFLNQAERNIFKNTYPNVYKYFFEKGLNRGFESHDAVASELKQISKSSPALFRSLARKGVSSSTNGSINYPLMPKNALESDKDNSRELVNKVMLELYFYRRSKSEWMAFSVGNEHDRTCEIEEGIKSIQESFSLSPFEKEKRILDTLQRHYFELYQSNSSNKLLYILENFLYKHGRSYEKDVANPGVAYKGVKLLGVGLKSSGELLKNIGRAAAFVVGGTGVFLEGFGNCFMFIGKLIKYSIIPAAIFWGVGKITSVIGRNLKQFTSNILSPILESLGDFARGTGKLLVQASGVYPVPKVREIVHYQPPILVKSSPLNIPPVVRVIPEPTSRGPKVQQNKEAKPSSVRLGSTSILPSWKPVRIDPPSSAPQVQHSGGMLSRTPSARG